MLFRSPGGTGAQETVYRLGAPAEASIPSSIRYYIGALSLLERCQFGEGLKTRRPKQPGVIDARGLQNTSGCGADTRSAAVPLGLLQVRGPQHPRVAGATRPTTILRGFVGASLLETFGFQRFEPATVFGQSMVGSGRCLRAANGHRRGLSSYLR